MTSAPVAVHLTTLGCARNDVDSEELAGRLADAGFRVVDSPGAADIALVNTCGFVEAAKRESVDAVLELAGDRRPVVAVGCLAERYGAELAAALPEAAAVLGFDDYPGIASRLRAVLAGAPPRPHAPTDRRRLLPLAPTDRGAGVGTGPTARPVRRRLSGGPTAPLKLASGCDRRCSFCAIPRFRGAFVSRPPAEVLAEARWLAAQGVRELFCVSENSTSYGKDLRDLRLLERLLPELAAVDGIRRVRVSYLQPAEVRPGLVDTIAGTPGVAPYFDLSFQHASPRILRRMRRFGSTARFLDLLAEVRARCPEAGVRSNVIVGFPGEDRDDLAELADFLGRARLDAVGVFGYSDEDGTEAAELDGKVDADEVSARAAEVAALAEELVAQRAEERVGSFVEVLIEQAAGAIAEQASGRGTRWRVEGRAAHQGPDVDGATTVEGHGPPPRIGDLVRGVVTGAVGADLQAVPA